MYRIGIQVFLVLSLLGMAGWIVARFARPILGVSHMGFMLLSLLSLAFVIALCLVELAFQPRKNA
jgi:hypothetical protein